ncbi:MAG: CDP-archaeol synthase [Geminicoccaceae bacterium]
MSLTSLLHALLLLALANGVPVLAKRLLGQRWVWPVDGGVVLRDGRRLLGKSKTWRGVVLGCAVPALAAPLLGLAWTVGALFGASAMAGDLLSSFIKRRAGVAASGRVPALDQLPEALLPLAVCRDPLGLDAGGVLLGAAIFWGINAGLSPLLYRLGVRDRPY